MMIDTMNLEYLSLSKQNDNKKMTKKIIVSLKLMMREKHAYGSDSIVISEDIARKFSRKYLVMVNNDNNADEEVVEEEKPCEAESSNDVDT
jgi:hypothetical protein